MLVRHAAFILRGFPTGAALITKQSLVSNLQTQGFFSKPKRDRNRPVRNNINNGNNVIATVIENPHTSIEAISEELANPEK